MPKAKPDTDQIERFKVLARELEADKDEGRFEANLRKIMAYRPKRAKPG